MTHAKRLAIAGLTLVALLSGCPRSKLPSGVGPRDSAFPPPPPWRVPSNSAARLASAGLPLVTDAHNGGFHIHAGLRIFFQGLPVVVPAGIGLDRQGVPVSPVHTHRDRGVIHVENPEPRDFTLGQFFALWGVPLGQAIVYADAAPVSDPSRLVFVDHQQIVVIFGSPPTAPLAWPKTSEPADDPEDHTDPEPSPGVPAASSSGDPEEGP